MKYKAICFDIDGTLYEPRLIRRYGLRATMFCPLLAVRYSRMRKKYREYQSDFESHGLQNMTLEQREAAVLSEITDGKLSVEKSGKLLRDRYYKRLEKAYRKLEYNPDVVKTFEKIHSAGIKTGVFTDWPLFRKLEQIGVSDFIDFKASSTETGYLKPDRHCFEYLEKNLDTAPEDMLYVGDSYSKDILGAFGAGIDSVLINADNTDESSYPEALKVFADWAAFDSWINEIIEEQL